MKVIWVFFLLVVFALSLVGCATTPDRYVIQPPPGGSQEDYQRDDAYCNDYTRTWCATNGTLVVSGSRQDYQWGQRDMRVSGNRGCDQKQFDTVQIDCMRMKGYTFTLQKEGQEKTGPPPSTVEKKTGRRYKGEFPPGSSDRNCFWELDRSRWVDGKRPPPQFLEWELICISNR